MNEFNPNRLVVARMCRGHNQTSLAEAVGISRRSITSFESGSEAPSQATLVRLANELSFPDQFFSMPDLEVPLGDTVSFRAMTKMKASQRDMALGEGALALALSKWIDTKFELPAPQIPDLSQHSSPEEAATYLRNAWGKGEEPIGNIIHLVERHGIRVFSLSIQSREVDAFSAWSGETPFIFLNTEKSAERSRFDAAHELGHLVLHRHVLQHGRLAEREADEFASSFLMPRKSVIAHAPRYPVVPKLIQLKKTWNVSLASLIYRLHAVGMLNDWQYRNLSAEIGRKGYRTTEPYPSDRELSQILSKVFAELRKEGINKASVALELGIYETTLDQLIFGLVITGLRGGARTTRRTSDSKASELKLVR
jgi:Zn-dependent peptidase ImmA (M78 family)/DNA-binding XRE family transcriptional regulator